jgi:hypothetical protein
MRTGRSGDAGLLEKLSPGSGSRGTWVPRFESAEPVRGFYEPHRNPTASRHGAYPTGTPRTKRHTPVHLLCVLKARKTAGQQLLYA